MPSIQEEDSRAEEGAHPSSQRVKLHCAQAYSEHFDTLLHLGRLSEAEDLLREAMTFFPNAHEVTVKWARLATIQRNYDAAAQRWLSVLMDYPNIQEVYLTGSYCLYAAGEAASASNLLRKGMAALPDAIEIWLFYVQKALDSGEIDDAKRRWLERRLHFSKDYRCAFVGATIELMNENLLEARSLLDESVYLNGGKEGEAQSKLRDKIHNSDMKNLLLQFESLGGRMEGCEFGLVQRAYGAEPLGLLRWSDMEAENLISALEQRFAGVGEAPNTILSSPHADGADWTTRDTRFGMNMHTFQYDHPTEQTRERLFKSICRRLKYLKDKLLEDLSNGNKIFVFKITYEALHDERLLRLHRAIRHFGPSTLFYVRQPDDEHPAGTVQLVRPGLIIGYIARFSYGFGHGATAIGPATEHWEVIVRRAYRLWREHESFAIPENLHA